MADISQEINDFKNAIYGEEVRGSMISLAEKINTEVEENTTNINQAVSTANSASSAANQAVADANTTLQAANQAVTSAEGSASAAAGSASAAAGHAEDAEESATAAAGSASAAAQSAADAAEVAEGLGGFNGAASSVTAQDVEGILGTPGAQSNVQALIDAIAEQVLNQLVKKSQIINNLLATQAGNVLDATQGKALKDLIDQLNSDMQNHFPPGLIWQTNSSNTYRYGFGSGSDGYMYIDNQNLSTKETTRLQFSKNGALDLLTINGGDINYIGHFISDTNIQYGIVTVNAAQNETTEFSVTFPRQFSSTPQVVVTVATSGPKDNIASVLSITTNGFKGYLYRGGVTANMSIRWIAIGY